jgi:hypothetical protein
MYTLWSRYYLHFYLQIKYPLGSVTKVSLSSTLLALHSCVGNGLFHSFVKENSSGGWLLAPRPKPNLEDQGLRFFWHLHFDLSGIGGSTRSSRSRQHSTPGRDEAVAFEEAPIILLFVSVRGAKKIWRKGVVDCFPVLTHLFGTPLTLWKYTLYSYRN